MKIFYLWVMFTAGGGVPEQVVVAPEYFLSEAACVNASRGVSESLMATLKTAGYEGVAVMTSCTPVDGRKVPHVSAI